MHSHQPEEAELPAEFRGRIAQDIRESVPDWEPYREPQAPDGAPNILYIVWERRGLRNLRLLRRPGQGPAPAMRRIADAGVRFTDFHTTALCSPTRSCLMTGRNATSNGMACVTEITSRLPNSNGRNTPEPRGVLFAQGGRFGGHSLYLLDGRLHYVYDWLGQLEQKVASPDRVPVGDHTLSAVFRADDRKDNGLTVGTLALRVDDREAGAIRIRPQPGMFACEGEGLCVGRDSGQAVSADYDPPFHFLGGTIRPGAGRRQRPALRRPGEGGHRRLHARPARGYATAAGGRTAR